MKYWEKPGLTSGCSLLGRYLADVSKIRSNQIIK
jgi:hypothetical protein